MALLLCGCVAPAVATRSGQALRPAAGLLPPRRRPARPRLVAVASASASSASSAASGEAAVASRARDNNGVAGGSGTNGAVSPTAKATAIETTVERVIFDFRFLALLAIAGSLAGSVLCFLNGCVFIKEAYQVYWSSCVKGIRGRWSSKSSKPSQRFHRCAFGIGPCPQGIIVVRDVCSQGTAKVDEDHIPGRAQDESRACHRDDSAGEDVREEQDGEDNHRAGPPQLLRLHLLVLGFSLHPAQSPQGRP
ncbi:unnamed protein product [Urochloa decumbens]|uniref:CASP-like protein n=1 Tax=Urochloa decumbens TaxID=240449 RepID=A0ABC9G0R3_9POAL